MNELEIGTEGRESDTFEQQLMQALRRVDAPEGFAARIMECAAPPVKISPMHPRFAMRRVRAWAIAAIVAILALGVFVGNQVHARHEREQAALAQQQFETAIRVTDHALDQTRAQLEHAGLNLGD